MFSKFSRGTTENLNMRFRTEERGYAARSQSGRKKEQLRKTNESHRKKNMLESHSDRWTKQNDVNFQTVIPFPSFSARKSAPNKSTQSVPCFKPNSAKNTTVFVSQ